MSHLLYSSLSGYVDSDLFLPHLDERRLNEEAYIVAIYRNQ